ncbi:hypothetical protein BKA80DRAFT_271931, partial [Phyllosticta citrichinensis]
MSPARRGLTRCVSRVLACMLDPKANRSSGTFGQTNCISFSISIADQLIPPLPTISRPQCRRCPATVCCIDSNSAL